MLENEGFKAYDAEPATNLEGKGYLKFPKPLSEQEFADELDEMKDCLDAAYHGLSTFTQRQTFQDAEEAVGPLLALQVIFFGKHPADIERLLQDETVFEDLSSFMPKVEEKVLPFLREYVEKCESTIPDQPLTKTAKELLRDAQHAFLQFKIYLASRLNKK